MGNILYYIDLFKKRVTYLLHEALYLYYHERTLLNNNNKTIVDPDVPILFIYYSIYKLKYWCRFYTFLLKWSVVINITYDL